MSIRAVDIHFAECEATAADEDFGQLIRRFERAAAVGIFLQELVIELAVAHDLGAVERGIDKRQRHRLEPPAGKAQQIVLEHHLIGVEQDRGFGRHIRHADFHASQINRAVEIEAGGLDGHFAAG